MNTTTSKKNIVFTLRLPLELHKKVVKAADELNISLSAYVKMQLTQLLNQK